MYCNKLIQTEDSMMKALCFLFLISLYQIKKYLFFIFVISFQVIVWCFLGCLEYDHHLPVVLFKNSGTLTKYIRITHLGNRFLSSFRNAIIGRAGLLLFVLASRFSLGEEVVVAT